VGLSRVRHIFPDIRGGEVSFGPVVDVPPDVRPLCPANRLARSPALTSDVLEHHGHDGPLRRVVERGAQPGVPLPVEDPSEHGGQGL